MSDLLTVNIQLHVSSQPITYKNVINVYEKGSFLCIQYYTPSKVMMLDKYPIMNVFRIVQDYGYTPCREECTQGFAFSFEPCEHTEEDE